MSKKYEDLQSVYAEQINIVKAAKKNYDDAKAKANSFEYGNDEFADWEASQKLKEEFTQASMAYHIVASKLQQDIEAEYWDVPFTKARNQGIEKFFELSGLDL